MQRTARAVPRVHCLVSDRDDAAALPALAAAGIDGFQVRAKTLDDARLVSFVETVLAAVRPYGATVIVNDRVDVALAAGADGVHLGRSDLPVRAARRVAPGLLIGATCRTGEQAQQAAVDQADYIGFGPVFATESKPGLPPPLGLTSVGRVGRWLPLIAIGGIAPASAREARAAGAHGVAVIGAIWRQGDPVAAARELLEAVA